MEQEASEPAKPLKNFLLGSGIPLAIITVPAVSAVLAALIYDRSDSELILTAAWTGALAGFVIAFFGVVEIVVGVLLSRGKVANRLYWISGYLMIFAAAGYVLWFCQ